MLRLFAALPLPDPVAEAVVRTQAKLVGARWSPRENLHITLRFIGDVDERRAQDIDSELGQIRLASFELSLHGAGHFGGDKPHALYLGVAQNDALERLNMACERACRRVGLAPDSRHYTPHATVCYLPRLQTIEPSWRLKRAMLCFQAMLGLPTASISTQVSPGFQAQATTVLRRSIRC
jgi:RNA 2',3'-cyclic 3'-phosphodiesterase